MRFLKCCAAAVALAASCVFAQVPPAEQLLPDDVVGVVTVPDWSKLMAGYDRSAWGQLFADPAMKPFRDNFTSNFVADFIKPIEKQLGVKLTDYQELLQGQITLAFTSPKEGSKSFVSYLLLIDAKDKSEQLKTRLAEFKKKWTDAGKDVKTEKIRDVEFNSFTISSSDLTALLKKAFPSSDPDEAPEEESVPEKIQLRMGQHKSMLIIGEDEKAIEKILARQGGGLVPPLAEKASYQKAHSTMFRDSLAHGWVNFKPIYQKILEFAAAEKEEPGLGMQLKIDKILPAIGLDGLETLSAKINSTADGAFFEFFAGIPESQRQGIFKVLTIEKKDASPPPFVPADVLKVQRSRIDLPRAWTTVEAMLGKIEPSLAGLLQLLLSSAGKDQDPNFDLKKSLISNLGDDIIQYQKPPKAAKVAELQAAPSVVMIGSPNPVQLMDAVRLLTSLMPPPLGSVPLKEREFLGKKIYSLSMTPPAAPLADDTKQEPAPGASLNFAASSGYVAFSSDNGALEEFLRSAENPPKPLRSVEGLNEAAQKIGGMENGLFSYQNQAESLRFTLEALKNDPEAFNRMLFFSLSQGDEEGQDAFTKLFNTKLLPSFDRISKYFGMALVSGGTTAEGFTIKALNPTPAGLKK